MRLMEKEDNTVVRRIKEVDDLALVECSTCHGEKTLGKKREKCPVCCGTGDRVIHQTKYYTVRQKK